VTTPELTKIVVRLDGVPVPPTLALLRPDDLGVLRGDGVFETTLAVGGSPRDLDEHLARMQASARMLDLALPAPDAWQPAIQTVLAGWTGGSEMVLRLIATRGPEDGGEPTCYVIGSALAESAVAARSGIKVLLLDRGFHGADVAAKPWLLVGAKSLSYAMNMAAGRYARSHGADDVIFIDTDGSVLEGPTSTVVLARGRQLVTPPREGILDGITARRLLQVAEAAGWSTDVRPVGTDELRSADALFLTSSTRILAPIVSLDGEARENDPAVVQELAKLLQVPGA
jgi:4-amino-4-deoxychorismate lyase